MPTSGACRGKAHSVRHQNTNALKANLSQYLDAITEDYIGSLCHALHHRFEALIISKGVNNNVRVFNINNEKSVRQF
uniref:Uncharacterized protein n=1 Tax=Lepeophtheirus salmonis TaxID=72036 RepID=A0A0K2U3R0_LEPSM